MELTVIATTLALSIGLGLAAAYTMLSTVLFCMARRIAAGPREPLTLLVRAA